MGVITRAFEFDSAHRVMDEQVKCYNLHGHRFKAELSFEYASTQEIGYNIDFKDIKKIAGGFIDRHLDHAGIFNPKDTELISLCESKGWKIYRMGLGKDMYCNPTAENIAGELFYIIGKLFEQVDGLTLTNVRLYETPTCWVDVDYPPSYA